MYTNNQFPDTFDKKLVGKYIARGGDCKVYHYGEHHVVKFSSLSKIGGKKMSNKLQSDYQFCRDYFGNYVLETRFFKTKRSRHTEIQPFVKGKELHMTDLKDPDIAREVKKIFTIFETIKQETGRTVDLGGLPFNLLTMHNILIYNQNKLVIVDAVCYDTADLGLVYKIVGFIVCKFGIFFQNITMNLFKKKIAETLGESL